MLHHKLIYAVTLVSVVSSIDASASGVFFDGLGPLSPAASAPSAFPVVTPPPLQSPSHFTSFHHPQISSNLNSISQQNVFDIPTIFDAPPSRSKLITPLVPASTQLTLSPGFLHRLPISPVSQAPVHPVTNLHNVRHVPPPALPAAPLPPPPALPVFPALHHVQVHTPHSFMQFAFPSRPAFVHAPSPFQTTFFGKWIHLHSELLEMLQRWATHRT